MKRLIPLFLFALLFCSCSLDIPINDDNYTFSDDILLSYNGYNSSIKNVNKINTADGLSIELYVGKSSFESLIFNFTDEKYIESINIKLDDSLSSPDINCHFCILYNNSYKLYDYNYSEINGFKSTKNISINKYCNNLKLFFSSNSSKKQKRIINLYTVDFIIQ